MSNENQSTAELLDRARCAWSKNQYLRDSPSYQEQPEARYIAELLSGRIGEVESQLLEFTRSPNQWLVANALMCFDLACSQAFMAEYDRLSDDARHVSLRYHSFSHSLPIGTIIRRLKKKYATTPNPPAGLALKARTKFSI